MARRKRTPQMGRKDRNARRDGRVSRPLPRLGRRRALWRFVGAMALAPLSTSAFGQGPGVPAAYMPPAYTPGAYQPAGYAPEGFAPAGYAGPGGGYATPAQGMGPMVAPQPMGMGSGPAGLAIPSGSVFTPRLVTQTGAGDGLGWDDGYTSVGAWLPVGINNDSQVLYLDARGFGSYTEGGGGNFNAGFRQYLPGADTFIGGFAGYDIDAGNSNSHDFQRFVVGAESVSKFLQMRVNGYIPVGDESHNVASDSTFIFFRENNLFFQDFTRYQYGGVDAEIGGPLPLIGKYGMSGYVGGYWLSSEVDDTAGFKGRLEANVNDDLQIGGKLTSDEIFDTNVWVTLTLRSPKGSWGDFFKRDWLRQPKVQTQMDRSPEREYRIATDVKTTDVLALDPTDGLPYLVLHVDPAGGGGPGTFEDPAGFIQGINTPAYDIVYVRPGTITTDGPITLFDNQRLLSTAVPHVIDTQRGVVGLPGFTGGTLPVLINSDDVTSSVITLANRNEVSGFRINGTGSANANTGVVAFHTGITGAGITGFDINRTAFENVVSGAVITHVGTGLGAFDENLVTGRGAGSGSSYGLSVAAINGSVLGLSVARNEITGFLGEDVNGSGGLDLGEDANANNVLDPGIGVNVVSAGASVVNARVGGNTLTGNGTGLRLSSQSLSALNASVISNEVTGNVVRGVQAEAFASTLFANLINNNVSNNGGPGIDAVGLGGANLTLFLGNDDPALGNAFNANVGAGVTMRLGAAPTGRLLAVNNAFTNTIDDGSTLNRFGGQGVAVFVTDDARFLDSYFDKNVITDNVSDGMLFTAEGLSTIRNVTIGNFDGNNNNGNLIARNLNGIGLIRTGNARVDELRVIDNEIVANVTDGIDFRMDGGLLDVVDVFVAQNNISTNGLDGIFGLIQSDAIINLDLQNNLFVSNGDDGVRIEQTRFAIDEGGVTGTWTGNVFANNVVHGIDISAPMNGLIVGTAEVGNTIAQNGSAGIFLQGPGVATFTRNLVTQNGASLNTGDPNLDNTFGAGIDIGGVGFKDFAFANNMVIDNFGDGVEIAVGEVGASQFFDLNFTDNVVARNTGRGYDILNQGSSQLNIAILGTAPGRSVIAENGREGVYVVNTASFAQTQTGPTPLPTNGNPDTDPTHGMQTGNSSVFANPNISFFFIQNQVVGNGQDQTSTVGAPTDSVGGTGLVFRIGTAGSSSSTTFEGGFASDGFAGVVASVTDNFFSGNFGADVYAESFTSTGDPNTGTTWSATEFNPNGYQMDPLARFDLTFVDNTYESTDFNNIGAFYDNADATFKSRTTGNDPNVNGPFNDAGRRRNAQRLADRGGLPPFGTPNPPGEPGEFEYPGMGESTFRISTATFNGTNRRILADGTIITEAGFAPFILDNQPFLDFTDANGVFYTTGPFPFGELPFGWSVGP